MSWTNPTGGGGVVALKIPAGNLPFLCRVIDAAREGLRDDLDRFGDRLRQPRTKLLLEDAAYATVLDALNCGRIAPDGELGAVVSRLAESVDHDNQYRRVVAEHDALRDLLGQLERRAD